MALCGLRDVRDYRVAAGQSPEPSGRSSSPFNIIDKSFRMHDFTQAKVAELYAQHTAETGQEFTAEAVDRAFDFTQGQPWLVNAIAREITDKNELGVLPPEPITAGHVEVAKERLILARATHVLHLADKLAEPHWPSAARQVPQDRAPRRRHSGHLRPSRRRSPDYRAH